MESAFVRNASTHQLLKQQAVEFVRVPVVGEVIAAPPQMWSVVRVVHGWNGPNGAVLEVWVTPAAPLTAPTPDHVSPF